MTKQAGLPVLGKDMHDSNVFLCEKINMTIPPLTLVGYSRRVIEVAAVVMLDTLALATSFFLAYLTRVYILPGLSGLFLPDIPAGLFSRLWWLPLVVLVCLAYEGLYKKRYPFWRETSNILKAVTLSYLIALAMVTLAKASDEVSRTFIVLSWIFSALLVPASRYAGKNALARAGVWRRRVLVIGAGKTGELVIHALSREPYLGYQVVGLLDDDLQKKQKIIVANSGVGVCVLGGFNDAEQVMASTGVRNLILAAPGLPAHALVDLVNRLQLASESLMVVPDLFGLPAMGTEAEYFFDERFLALHLKNNLASHTNIFLKRAFDLATGCLLMLLLLPLIAATALAVKLDSPGPVIFTHRRIGRCGQEFKCYKFRTMIVNAQDALDKLLKENPALRTEWEKDFKLKDDPRITRIGKILRKTSLDELPQIFNVLKGEMSLVGPRPIVRKEIEKYGEQISYFYQVHPGMTGLWQISGRSEVEYDERVQMDTWYIRNWSLWLDITLLIRTATVVLIRKGAY